MNPEEGVAYLRKCQRTLSEARSKDKKSIQMIEELFMKHLMSENQAWVIDMLSQLGVGKKYIEKLGYNIHKNQTAQDRYFETINKRLYTLKDQLRMFDREFLLRIITDIDIIDRNIDKSTNIKNLIFEIHQEQYRQMHNYFELVVTHNFDEVKDLIRNGDIEGPNSIAVKLGTFVNEKNAEMMNKIEDLFSR